MVLLWGSFDVIIADQVSAVIPVLRWKRRARILFYCHFPDLLLAKRQSWLRKAYRAPIDWVEERTTGKAFCTFFTSVCAYNLMMDGVCVNVTSRRAASNKEAVLFVEKCAIVWIEERMRGEPSFCPFPFGSSSNQSEEESLL
jgi:hypothetical protein